MPGISNELQNQLIGLLPALLLLFGLFFAVMADPYLKKRYRWLLIAVILTALALVAEDNLQKLWEQDPEYRVLRTISSVFGYIMRPVLIVLFLYIVYEGKKRVFFWIPVAVNAAVYGTALFGSGLAFTFSENYGFIRGPLGFCCFIISIGLVLCLLALTIYRYRHVRRTEALIPVLNAGMVIAASFMDLLTTGDGAITFVLIAVCISSMQFYIWLHLQFVREHEQALLSEGRIQIMISQIQPHFLFNTLTTIQALCLENPKKAASVTKSFASYLRQNIDSLNQGGLIPFRKEMDHTMVYVQIEMERFPYIRFDYEIEDDDFELPALTIQPLVENAIRHGVRIREKGQINIITRREAGFHEILIQDNGRGFSPESVPSGGSHIGIKNVRERLETMCGGSMEIDSRENEGTTVTIRIPVRDA